MERDDIVTGQIRGVWDRFPVSRQSIEQWAEWTRHGKGGPVFALARIYDLGAREWAKDGEKGLETYNAEQLAARKRSEPLQEAGRDPKEPIPYDERVSTAIDEMLHRVQTPAVWRAVAFSFLTKGPERDMPWLASLYMRRVNPDRHRKPMRDDSFVTAMDSLFEFIDLMVEDMKRRSIDLTPLQREVLQHRANGHSVIEIQAMYPRLGPTAVKGQITEAMRKLGAYTGEQAIAMAMRKGLIV